MNKDVQPQLLAEMRDIVRRAYEAGYRDGRAAAEAKATKAIAGTTSKGARRKDWGKIRPAIYAAVVAAPGRSAQELIEATSAKANTVRMTLADFVTAGYVRKDETGGFVAVDPARHGPEIAPKPRALKDAVLGVIRARPSATTADVIAALDQKPTSVRASLYALREDGEITGTADGWTAAP